MHGIHGIFLFQNSLFDFVKCARRNSRKRRCCAGLPCGISISHKFHKYLSLRDGFLDGLEELGRCAALYFVILVFWQGMVAFGILICKDNNFF